MLVWLLSLIASVTLFRALPDRLFFCCPVTRHTFQHNVGMDHLLLLVEVVFCHTCAPHMQE